MALVHPRRWAARLRRCAALLAVVAAGGLATGVAVVVVAAPAAGQPAPSADRPATGSLYLDGLGATTALGIAVPFGTYLSNDGPGAAAGLRTLIKVSLPGAGARDLRIDRHESGGPWASIASTAGSKGNVTFVDDSDADRWMMAGTVLTSRYRLILLSKVASDEAVITAEAQHRIGSKWLSLARSPRYVTKLTPASTRGLGQPFSPAPTLSAAPSPTTLDSELTADGQPTKAPAAAADTTAPWLVTSRFGTAISIVVVAGLLAVACWFLRRAVALPVAE